MSNLLRLALLVAGILLGATPALAAFNDVSLTTDAIISVNGISLTISGSTAVVESITINATNFTAQLNDGSNMTVASSDRYQIDVADSSLITSSNCSSTENKVTFGSTSAAAAQTVTVTPSTSVCSGSQSGGSGGSSGSNSQGGNAATKKVAKSTPTPAAPASVPGVGLTTALAAPTMPLALGAVNGDVRLLQQILNSDPETMIASSGVGSPGNETTYFGALTKIAVQKFQVKYGIAAAGNSGYGLVGPKTLAKLQSLGQ